MFIYLLTSFFLSSFSLGFAFYPIRSPSLPFSFLSYLSSSAFSSSITSVSLPRFRSHLCQIYCVFLFLCSRFIYFSFVLLYIHPKLFHYLFFPSLIVYFLLLFLSPLFSASRLPFLSPFLIFLVAFFFPHYFISLPFPNFCSLSQVILSFFFFFSPSVVLSFSLSSNI